MRPSREATQRDDWGDEEAAEKDPALDVRRGPSIGSGREGRDGSRGGRGGRDDARSFREDGNRGFGGAGRGSGFGASRSPLFGQSDTRERSGDKASGSRYYGDRGGGAQGEARPAASWRGPPGEAGGGVRRPSERSAPRPAYASDPGASSQTMAADAPASAKAIAAAYAASRPAAAKPLPLPVVREHDSDKGTFFHGASFRGSGASAEVISALAAIGITRPSHVQVWTNTCHMCEP